MSRTKRKHNPKMRLGDHLGHKRYKDNSVRDGTPQHPSSGCENHGGCPYCESNKFHSLKKRKERADYDED